MTTTNKDFIVKNGLTTSGTINLGNSTANSAYKLIFGKAQSASESNLPVIGQLSAAGAGNDLALASTSTSGTIRFFTGASTNSAEFATGSNTERMRIDSSGNVGIGVSPSNKLHVYSTNARPVTFGNASSTWTFGPNGSSFAFRENSASADQVTIDSSGNVGVNTASPATFGRFSVVNTTSRWMAVSSTGVMTLRYDDNSQPFMSLQNLGITGANQGYGINVLFGSDGATAGTAARVSFITEGAWTTGTASTQNTAITLATATTGTLTERMRITSGGSLLVGTTSSVGTNGQFTGSLAITATSGAQYLLMGNQDSTGTNKPGVIYGANGAITIGYGNSWASASGGSVTAMMTVSSSGIFDGASKELGLKDIAPNTNSWARGEANVITAGTTVNTATAGGVYYVYNNSAASVTLTQGSGVTMYLGGTSTTGNRTLLPRGFATIWFRTASECVINGNVT